MVTWTLSQEDVPLLEFWHDDGCRVHHAGKSLAGRRVLAGTAVDPSQLSDVLVMRFGFREAECWAHGRLPCE